MTLQTQITETETQIAPIQERLEYLRNKADINAMEKRERSRLGAREGELQTRLNILRTSRTSEEAAQRERIFKTQVTREQVRQRAPVRSTPTSEGIGQGLPEDVALYRKWGYSISAAQYLARAGGAQQVTFSRAGARRVLIQRGRVETSQQKYQRMGFTPSEARFLAVEGETKKVDFTKTAAERTLRVKERVETTQQQYKQMGFSVSEARTLGRAGEKRKVDFTKAGARRFLVEKEMPPEKFSTPAQTIKEFFLDPKRAVIISKYDPMSILTTPFKEEGTRDVTLFDIKDIYRTAGLPGKVTAEFIPGTYGETALLVGGVGLYGKLPTIARVGVSTYIGYAGIKTAATPTLPIETRIAGGIVGGLGVAGVTAETIPFVRGAISRVSPEFKPVVTAKEGFRAVELKETRIGLIPERAPLKEGITTVVKLPTESPLVRGGFGRRPGGERIFIGENQYLATSQRGLFKVGKEIPIEKEFFVTPQEPFIKIPETRISRLGIVSALEIPKQAELGFGIPPKPQIGVTIGAVGRRETPTQFVIGKGTELEAIKTTGIVTGVERIGTTTIRGHGVDIFRFQVGEGRRPSSVSDIIQTTRTTTRVSGEGVFGTAGLRPRTTTAPTTEITVPTTFLLTSTIPTITTRPTVTYRPSPPISIPITPPVSPPITPPISPPVTPPISPPVTPPISPPRHPPYRPPITPPKYPRYKFKPIKQPKRVGGITVFLRRYGKFKPIATGVRTPKQAFDIGRQAARTTLAATFMVRGAGIRQPRKIKGFRTKKTPRGIEFIELRKLRLDVPSEVKEIQKAKRRKSIVEGLF